MSAPTARRAQEKGKENEREVTDPITHLPILIHDASTIELEQIPPPPSAAQERQRQKESVDVPTSAARHSKMEDLINNITREGWWGDPLGDQSRTRVQTAIVAAAAAAGIGGLSGLLLYSTYGGSGKGMGFLDLFASLLGCIMLSLCVGTCALALKLVEDEPKLRDDTPVQDFRHYMDHGEDDPESAEWLNSFLKSVWPIVNPALFVPVADMLEDSLQATLPKLIHGVRCADVGQGSEPVRIMGIRWLDAGSAGKDIDGMKAEEGNFVNLELSLAYRAKSTNSTGLRGRSANVHILMQFWLAGGVVLPVWVEMAGLLANARLRIQLTPNPPFLSLMTLTLLGQPKIVMKCTPLAKNFLNVMDIPGLSSWLQSSIDAAVGEYVAPRSLTLDLKAMLAGRPKMDTDAIGVVIITIRQAWGFKSAHTGTIRSTPQGEQGDTYVTVGWSKWGRPMWSTRIIKGESYPVWEETTTLLVGTADVNASERLQLQLWDSDRFTADDLLGNVEVPLAQLMSDPATHNNITDRQDRVTTARGEPASGEIYWECGYYDKTSLDQHLAHKQQDAEKLKQKIEQEAGKKLREAIDSEGTKESGEVEQQKREDLKERSDEIISGSSPTQEWPSGILSIRIEQITGLEVDKIKESGVKDVPEDDEAEDLPSAYCTIIINHQRAYKTRTKMKASNPYFDAGTERFIRDWRNATVMIAVRDNRLHENDPLLGIVVLPLREVFKHRSQFVDSLPIIGGIGYGRMRLSLTFRSIQVHLPRRLLGWDVGTLEIYPSAKATLHLPADFATCHLVFRTTDGKGRMRPSQDGGWVQRRNHPLHLPVKKRYASALDIQFRKHAVGPDHTPAFCTLWLKDIPDDEEVSVSLPVFKNESGTFTQSPSNAPIEVHEDLGRLELRLRFWSGLSGYHHIIADKDVNMADVMEVLDCAEGTQDKSHDLLSTEEGPNDMSESSAESSDGEGGFGGLKLDREKSGALGGLKEFKKKQRELHRRHRGLMQWKAARNVAWIGRELEETTGKIGSMITRPFKHQDRETSIETEV